jgi:hypothetical protein
MSVEDILNNWSGNNTSNAETSRSDLEKSDYDKNDTEEIFFHQPTENSTPLASSSRIIEPTKDIQKCVTFNTFDNSTLVRSAYDWTSKTKR